jgi:hypothetical protein
MELLPLKANNERYLPVTGETLIAKESV